MLSYTVLLLFFFYKGQVGLPGSRDLLTILHGMELYMYFVFSGKNSISVFPPINIIGFDAETLTPEFESLCLRLSC